MEMRKVYQFQRV